MVATPLLRERLLGAEDGGKENGGASPASHLRRALWCLEESTGNAAAPAAASAAASPWAQRTKALTSAAAPSRMSPADAQRTRANVTKARVAIEQWARVAAADAAPSPAPPSPPSPDGVRCSPDVRACALLGLDAAQQHEPQQAQAQRQQQPSAAAVAAAEWRSSNLALPSHPRIAAALEESAEQLRASEVRVQREEAKVGQLRRALAEERQQRADRDQQWETLHGRCEQRIRVLEKLRRSERAESGEREEAEALRCGEQVVASVQWLRRARVLRQCVARWARQSTLGAAERASWSLLSAVWSAWARHAAASGFQRKLTEYRDELAQQNQEYIQAVSNAKAAAEERLRSGLESQRKELMQKHASELRKQQADFDAQAVDGSALLHSVATSMHVRYVAGLLRAGFGWLWEMAARRRGQEIRAAAHAQVQQRWLGEKLLAEAFRSWSHAALSAVRQRFERLCTGVATTRERACRRALFDAWLGALQRHRWHAAAVDGAIGRRQRKVLCVCCEAWREHTAVQRYSSSTLAKFVTRLSNLLLYSAFAGWCNSVSESLRSQAIVQRVILRMTAQNLSSAFGSWKEQCRRSRVLTAVMRQMMNRCLVSAWRAWAAAAAAFQLARLQSEAQAQQASLRDDFRSRLQTMEQRMEAERQEESALLVRNFESQLGEVRGELQDRIVRGILMRWRSACVGRCLEAWRGCAERAIVARGKLIRQAFGLWRWYVAASRRMLVRQLRGECEASTLGAIFY